MVTPALRSGCGRPAIVLTRSAARAAAIGHCGGIMAEHDTSDPSEETGGDDERFKALAAEVGKIFRAGRLGRGLTQDKVSQKTGVPQYYITALEHGLQNPTLKTLLKLADALELHVSALIPADDRPDGREEVRRHILELLRISGEAADQQAKLLRELARMVGIRLPEPRGRRGQRAGRPHTPGEDNS
jgi:transcriptional regulator with XRE-family HTH domain